jgi:hypothetical protein
VPTIHEHQPSNTEPVFVKRRDTTSPHLAPSAVFAIPEANAPMRAVALASKTTIRLRRRGRCFRRPNPRYVPL